MSHHLAGSQILLASYPKSGNTWVRALLSALYDGENAAGIDLSDLQGTQAISAHMQACPFPFNLLSNREQELWFADACRNLPASKGPFTFVKTHLPLRKDLTGRSIFPVETVRGVIHIVRHPFDVVPSLANHMGIGIQESVDFLLNSAENVGGGNGQRIPERWGSWSSHARSWLDAVEPFPILLVHYEDLRADAARELRRILGFLGESGFDGEAIARAVELSSFDRLKSQEAERGFRERPTGCPSFFRSGKVGEGWTALDPDQRTRIHLHCATEMLALGYSGATGT